MKKKSKKIHVKISARFLLGFPIMKKLYYIKLIYVYIKLKYNYYLQHKPNDYFKLDVDEISKFFHIHRTTVFKCLKSLTAYGLLEKDGKGKYRILSEEHFVRTLKEYYNEDPNSKDPFLTIYNNEFMDLWSEGINAKEAMLYYYLVHNNKHQSKNEEWLEAKVSQTQTCKDLGIDHRTYKKFIKHLIDIGYLSIDNKKKLYTENTKVLVRELLCHRCKIT